MAARYGATVALQPLDLDIAQGEFVTLLGPSGCGKTTTLRLIAGFILPQSGKILFDDEDVSRVPPNRRQIGMVFQDYALFPHMTVAENIAFGLQERGVPRATIAVRVAELLGLIRLPQVAQRYPAQLSGGQRQRVALARAVAYPPRVLLMDEPLGALDVKLRETMQAEIRNIQRSLGITTVFVTHDQAEAMNLSDRIIVMDHGRIVQIGSARDLYKHPASHFVADFFGRVNLLPVELCGISDGIATVALLGATLTVVAAPVSGGATLALRPEQLRLLPPAGPAPGGNTLPGRVTAIRFLGNVLHCEVALSDTLQVLVETRPDDALAVPGGTVRVTWSADQGSLLAAVNLSAPGRDL